MYNLFSMDDDYFSISGNDNPITISDYYLNGRHGRSLFRHNSDLKFLESLHVSIMNFQIQIMSENTQPAG